MIIDACTFDVSHAPTVEACAEAMLTRASQSFAEGADIVLFPEYAWAPALTLERNVLHEFWTRTVPALAARLDTMNKLLVLGTAPCFDDATGALRNRAIIVSDGQVRTQDKLFLTPWERSFTRGTELNLLSFRGARIAVVICLDIEVPELSAQLRGQGIDVVLVPSATETILGCERVTRCASARAVELGCAVVVSPLVGRCDSALVDENLGKLGCYLPSQAAFAEDTRRAESDVITEGLVTQRFTVDLDRLATMRRATSETNPSLLNDVSIDHIRFTTH